MKPRAATAILLLTMTVLSHAAESEPQMSPEEFMASLKFQQDTVTLPGGKATLQIPSSFRYLDPQDTERVLVMAWGNPSGDGTLGMLFPAELGPLDDQGWGVVISYDEDGHVSDQDADAIDYADLLKDMQHRIDEENAERVQAGYGALNLVGWAEPPQYDKDTRKMYWAKELQFDGAPENTLNYNVRVLGRDGVLVLNAVAGMSQLAQIKEHMPTVIAFTNFSDGSRYTDFNPDTDKLATYGLAALVGGAVAAKAGLFAKLGVLLLAGKKFIIIALLAIGGLFAKFFKRKGSTTPE